MLLLALAMGAPAVAQTTGPNVAQRVPSATGAAPVVGAQPTTTGPQPGTTQPAKPAPPATGPGAPAAGPQPGVVQPAKPTTLPPATPNAPAADGTTSDELVNLPAFAEPV